MDSLYSGLILTMETSEARKESMMLIVEFAGSWLRCSASLKKRSYGTQAF